MSISVALADDQALVRMGLRVLIGSETDLVLAGEAEDGRQAVALVRRTRPDVVLMDIRMPVLDGIAALRLITADPELGAVRVIMLTTFELDEYVFEALQAGAAGFLIKDSEGDPARSGGGVAALSLGDATGDRLFRLQIRGAQEPSAAA
jgi:DNA-binding NarL/FixJ family response regulator